MPELELWKVGVAVEVVQSPGLLDVVQSPGLLDVLVRSVRSPLPWHEAHRCSPHSQIEQFAPVPAGAAVEA